MAYSKKQLGKIGEDEACQFLLRNHYAILERNWRSGYSEIDVIVQHQRTNQIIFVEVKTRSTIEACGVVSVSENQKMALSRAMEAYCSTLNDDIECRFDLLIVLLNHPICKIHHYKEVFSPGDFV